MWAHTIKTMANEDINVNDSPESRRTFLSQMQSFVEKECSEIGEILAHMSWTPDHILRGSPMARCPHDTNHFVPKSSLKQHAAVCNLRQMGLTEQDVELQLQDDDFFYKNADLVGTVKLDEGLLNRIIWNHCMEKGQVHMGHRTMPVGTDDWFCKLSPQDRLAVYNHCVQTLTAAGKMANVEKDEVLTTDWERIVKKGLLEQGGVKPKSKFELLALLRDQKRRRQSYRAKNVHVTRKSYTEIIREVIVNQMEIMMPSAEPEQTPREEQAGSAEDRPSGSASRQQSPSCSRGYPHHSANRQHSPLASRDYQRNPHHRSRSRSPKRKKSRKSRSRSPHRRSKSQSPRENSGSISRRRKDADNHSSGSRKTRDTSVERDADHHSSGSRKRRDTSVERDADRHSSSSRKVRDRSVERDSDNYSSISRKGRDTSAKRSSSLKVKQDEEEGEIGSDDSISSRQRHRSSRKKSSKHKKHKHKKHKSKTAHSDSDDGR